MANEGKEMTAFAVKHIEEERGPLASIMKKVKKQPYVFTSKKAQAIDASMGGWIYMIEVLRGKGITSYRLGYKFKASEKYEGSGGALWEGKFKYKITVAYGVSLEGMYFDEPVVIDDAAFISWFKSETLGMAKIPSEYIDTLEKTFSDLKNDAKSF
jgi:hypothetical protein